MCKINRKRASFFFFLRSTPAPQLKPPPPTPCLPYNRCGWLPLSPNFASTPFCPTPEPGATIQTPLQQETALDRREENAKGGWGAVEKEIWLFNTKTTGMQGVNPFEGSSANKGQASRQRLVGICTGGRGWLSLTIWPFCLGEGGWWRGRYSVAPPSP